MRIIDLIPWIFPLSLLVFFIYRKSKGKNSSGSKYFGRLLFSLFIFGIVGAGVVQFNELRGRGNTPSKQTADKQTIDTVTNPVRVTPEMYSDMIPKGNDYIGGELIKRGYKQIEVHDGKYTIYKYVLMKGGSYDPTVVADVIEYISVKSDEPGQVSYVMTDYNDFKSFTSSLKKIGDSVHIENYPRGEELVGKYFVSRCKDCVFSSTTENGYINVNGGYTIKMVDVKLLKQQKPKPVNSRELHDKLDGIKRNPDGSINLSDDVPHK
jgi:hypothetical protein